ncbi:Methylated-DNA--protein-cysteine methyltransferase [subsurface metagenome]
MLLEVNKSKFNSKIGFIYYLWMNSEDSGERIIFLSNKKESFDQYIEELKIKYKLNLARNPKIKNKPSPNKSLKALLLNELKSEKIENAIIDYLSGKLKEIGIKPYFLTGSEFEKKVWNSAISILYGSTISYKDLAQRAGHPLACRAAGTAMKNNPVMLVVPCHRVIKSNGKLGNFGGGVEIKNFLVNLEASRK